MSRRKARELHDLGRLAWSQIVNVMRAPDTDHRRSGSLERIGSGNLIALSSLQSFGLL
jgi:hypothetical protein